MKKLYSLIFISIFPLITTAQLSNIPDSLTELSVDELRDMRTHKEKSLVAKVGTISKEGIKSDKKIVVCPPPKQSTLWPVGYWRTDWILNSPMIREEENYENK
tara:strand:- start:665 stop:973 length:309 start_codon:yes stop_codon:yes gene_type:complete